MNLAKMRLMTALTNFLQWTARRKALDLETLDAVLETWSV